jgi:hypothetical protein
MGFSSYLFQPVFVTVKCQSENTDHLGCKGEKKKENTDHSIGII